MVLALRKLTRRAYSEKELELYLQKQKFSGDEILAVLAKLKKWGYLNDQQLAANLYEYYLRNKSYGYFYIRQKLHIKNIPAEIINSLLENYDLEQEFTRAQTLTEKFIKNKKRQKQPFQLGGMLSRYLSRRGFHQSTIRKIMHEFLPEID